MRVTDLFAVRGSDRHGCVRCIEEINNMDIIFVFAIFQPSKFWAAISYF